ncbi:MAG: transcriptional regulator [Oscillatoria sp. Prado101]|jgi:DNA-binding phage protein|nr:transcriptional regulator [Oscillatoria sp. Prado101]
MKAVKMPTSDSYREFLIESLKDREHAAGFIEAILEEKEPEPELLRNALKKVVDARLRMDSLSQSAKQKWEKLDKMLSETGGSEIYTLVELLDALGFRLAVTLKEENNA